MSGFSNRMLVKPAAPSRLASGFLALAAPKKAARSLGSASRSLLSPRSTIRPPAIRKALWDAESARAAFCSTSKMVTPERDS